MAWWMKLCTSEAEAVADRAALERDAFSDLPADEVSFDFEFYPSPFDEPLRSKSGQSLQVALINAPDYPNKKWWHEWLEKKGWKLMPKG